MMILSAPLQAVIQSTRYNGKNSGTQYLLEDPVDTDSVKTFGPVIHNSYGTVIFDVPDLEVVNYVVQSPIRLTK